MKFRKLYIVCAVWLGILSACNDLFRDINDNPLSLTEVPSEALFTNAVHKTFGGRLHLKWFELQFASQYAHIYVTNNEMRQADMYQSFHIQDVYDYMFTEIYTSPLKHIEEVLRLTSEGSAKNEVQNAIARVVACINYAKVTDCYGDIPYFKGAQGQAGELTPAYDAQKVIYKDMIEQLGACIEILKSADPKQAYPGADPIYDNQLDKWRKFANSLRLRLAMRARFADPDTNPIIAECLGEPLLEDNEDNFQLERQDSDRNELYNQWYEVRLYDDFKMSDFFVTWLNSTNDPRLHIFVAPATSGGYKGFINGLDDNAIREYNWGEHSDPMPVLTAKDTPRFIMTASEIWFLRAEAALFQLGTGVAEEMYQTGIRKSMELWNIPDNEITTFINDEPVSQLQGDVEQQYEQICRQAWIAFVPNFTEAWFNIRRTGYPTIEQRTAQGLSKGVTNGYLPKRFLYTTSEYNRNRANVEEAVARQGEDLIDTPVWWDVRN